MRSDNELLRELQRLNRSGVINDAEFLVLRKIIVGGRVSPEIYRRFDSLFSGDSKSIPVQNETKMNRISKEEKPLLNDERLYSMAEAINELNLKLTALGRFDNSRELLTCPACELFEDVTSEGMLITAEPVDPKVDTGLRFVKVNDEEWECPDCGHLCREEPA
jgi:hypothetical protein